MGFLKAQSKPSLIAGTGVGLSFIAIEQIIPNHPELGHSLAMGLFILLSLFINNNLNNDMTNKIIFIIHKNMKIK